MCAFIVRSNDWKISFNIIFSPQKREIHMRKLQKLFVMENFQVIGVLCDVVFTLWSNYLLKPQNIYISNHFEAKNSIRILQLMAWFKYFG